MNKELSKYQRFKQGLKNLTPLQQLKAKATGSIWGAFGLSLAFIGLTYRTITNFSLSQLGFSIFVFVLIGMQIIQYIGIKQQIAVIKEAETKLNLEGLEKLGL